jgi:hypothetical protein
MLQVSRRERLTEGLGLGAGKKGCERKRLSMVRTGWWWLCIHRTRGVWRLSRSFIWMEGEEWDVG